MRKKNMLQRSAKYFISHDLVRWMPDRLYLQLFYYAEFGKLINFKNPKTFNEKLNWLKLNYRRPELTTCVDKHEVKKYVADKIGEEYIIPTIGVWDSFDEINFVDLPDQFVLKCTHDSGGLVICKDKSKLNLAEARKKINHSLSSNYYYWTREWPYKNVKPRIIAEPYMEDQQTGELRDYKFFCFNGEPKLMFVATERGTGNTAFDFFDMQFKHLDIAQHYRNADILPSKPKNFDKMIELAKEISVGFPHVRVDLYEANGKVYFGEMTFYHFGAVVPFEPKEWDAKIGSLLTLPDRMNE